MTAASVPTVAELLAWMDRFLRCAAPLESKDSFNALGVDSALATELVFALSEKLGIEVDPTLVYDCRTVGAFAEHVHSLANGDGRTT